MSFDLRRAAVVRDMRYDPLFIGKIDLEVVNEPELTLVAQIERLADDAPAAELVGLYSENTGKMRRQIRFRIFNGKPQIGDADRHGGQFNHDPE